MNILIIDNDYDIADVLKEYIEYVFKFHTTIAYEYDEAEKLLLTTRPDLVLLDMQLDKLSFGLIDICERRCINFVPMSGSRKYRDDVRSAYFLDKPFALSTLEKIIKDNKNYIDENKKSVYNNPQVDNYLQ